MPYIVSFNATVTVRVEDVDSVEDAVQAVRDALADECLMALDDEPVIGLREDDPNFEVS